MDKSEFLFLKAAIPSETDRTWRGDRLKRENTQKKLYKCPLMKYDRK